MCWTTAWLNQFLAAAVATRAASFGFSKIFKLCILSLPTFHLRKDCLLVSVWRILHVHHASGLQLPSRHQGWAHRLSPALPGHSQKIPNQAPCRNGYCCRTGIGCSLDKNCYFPKKKSPVKLFKTQTMHDVPLCDTATAILVSVDAESLKHDSALVLLLLLFSFLLLLPFLFLLLFPFLVLLLLFLLWVMMAFHFREYIKSNMLLFLCTPKYSKPTRVQGCKWLQHSVVQAYSVCGHIGIRTATGHQRTTWRPECPEMA